MYSKEDVKMTPKECLIQFKEAYCEKDPEFRCDECLDEMMNAQLMLLYLDSVQRRANK